MIPLKNPTSHYEEDYHSHDFFIEETGDHVCTIEFDDIEEERGDLKCEVMVTWHLGQENAKPIVIERVNLMAKTSGNLNKVINSLIGDEAYLADWRTGFNEAVFSSVIAFRGTATEGAHLEWKESTAADMPFLLKPFISSTGTTVLFAPPGSNKSMFAMRLGLGIATGLGFNGQKPTTTGSVLFVDFEDEKSTHDFRLTALARSMGLGPEDIDGLIYHERVSRSLRSARRRLRKLVRDLSVVLVVVDSISRARGSDVSSSEATVKMFSMFAQLGVPILAIDHLTKDENKRIATSKYDAREAQPLGSVITQAATRLAWFMNLLPNDEDLFKRFNLYNTKHNNVAQQPTMGMTFRAKTDQHDVLYNAEFEVSNKDFYTPTHKIGAAEELLIWHFRQQRDAFHAIAMTQKDMQQSGVKSSTIRGIVTQRNKEWWEQVEGTKKFIISTFGLEVVIGLDGSYATKPATNEEVQDD